MIKGSRKIDLTTDKVLQRISEYDVFKYYMPNSDWKINELTYSPFRKEHDGSFIIGTRNGRLTYCDFGNAEYRGDCFDFVRQMHNLPSITETLAMIDRDFGLGFLSTEKIGEYKRIQASYKQPEEELGKRYSVIQVVTKPFTNEELRYWAEFHQDVNDLRRENIFSIKKLYYNRKLWMLSPTELRFGYLYGEHWKIYTPLAPKKKKWVPNNVPITEMDGKSNVINCDTTIVNKSKKDYMVLLKVFPCSCAVQNESIACFSEENVKFLKDNSKKQILSFDSDATGVSNSQQITKLFGFGYCNVPKKYLSEEIKDWAELSRRYGMKVIEDYLKEKQII